MKLVLQMVSKWLHVSSLHEAAMIQIPQMSLSPQPPRRFGWGTWTGFWGPIVQLTNYEANFLASGGKMCEGSAISQAIHKTHHYGNSLSFYFEVHFGRKSAFLVSLMTGPS